MPTGICFNCEVDGSIHKHHVVPKSLGGVKTVPLCLKCHGLVHGRDFLKARELQRKGIEKAKKEGKFKGRCFGKETISVFLGKYRNKKVAEYLNKGYKGAEISKLTGVHINTITKIKKAIKSQNKIVFIE